MAHITFCNIFCAIYLNCTYDAALITMQASWFWINLVLDLYLDQFEFQFKAKFRSSLIRNRILKDPFTMFHYLF